MHHYRVENDQFLHWTLRHSDGYVNPVFFIQNLYKDEIKRIIFGEFGTHPDTPYHHCNDNIADGGIEYGWRQSIVLTSVSAAAARTSRHVIQIVSNWSPFP